MSLSNFISFLQIVIPIMNLKLQARGVGSVLHCVQQDSFKVMSLFPISASYLMLMEMKH